MADCTDFPTPEDAKRFKNNAGSVNEFVTSDSDTFVDQDGGEHLTVTGIQQRSDIQYGEIQQRSDIQYGEIQQRSDIQYDNINISAENQRDQFDATFQAQFAYAKIGNISDYVGDSLPESDKLNSYQYPDDSGEWYGPIQSQAFPITIPADPSVDVGWASTTAATQGWVTDTVRNPNLLYNHNFLVPSPDNITHPSVTPADYLAGTQIFSGVFVESDVVGLTYINGRVKWVNATGAIYLSVPNTNGLEHVTEFTASVADFDGKPRTRGVSFGLVGAEHRVTVGINALEDVSASETLLGSIKFEQGKVATGHEVQVANGRTYTFNTVAEMIAAGAPVGSKVNWQGYHEQSDGGSNWGIVKSGTHTEDGGSIFSIDANTYIEANLKGKSVNAAKFGLQEGVSLASSNHTRALKLFAYAKSNNTPELKFSAFYFLSGEISITQQGLRLTFSSKWNESGLQMTSAAGAFSAMLIFDAQNIVLKGGFFATESNQTSIFIRDGGKSHLEDFVVKFSEYGVLWEKGNAIVVKGMYAEVCVNGFVAQPRGEGDCNGGTIQGRAYGCTGVGLELRPNIEPTGAGAPPLHNSIDFSCEAGGVGFKSYEARNNVGVIYCEGNTTNYDVDGTANLWTLKNADNQPDIIKDFASGFDFRGGTSYFNPCYIERRIQNRDFTSSGSLVGNGIDIYIVRNNSGLSKSMTLGFLSYIPVGHKCEIYMHNSSNLLSLIAPSGITLIGDSSDLYGGPTVNDVVRLTVTKTSTTEAILWRT